jgi:hypothetical protein
VNIGDIFFALRGDGGQLQIDAKKAAEAAGITGGQAFGVSYGSSLKRAAGAALGGLAGFATGAVLVGAQQLDAATRQLQADTGLTGEAAKAAEKDMASMYQNNLAGFDQIGATLGAVINGLHLAGKAAADEAQRFLKFEEATGKGAEAVDGIRGVLDAWDIDVAKSGQVMDALVASHQKYGTNISEDIDLLTKLSPTLKAANLSWEDGVAMLNLFTKAGISAEKIPTALTKALKTVKSSEELRQLLVDIGNIEDPFIRAQKAAAIFGNRAGPQLAQALARGSLADFAINMDEAAGATDRAAAAVESGFGAQFTLILHKAGGALAEFGTQFGPLLILASVLGPSMIKLVSGAIGGLIGSRLVVAASAAAGGAIGGLYETAWLEAAYGVDAIKGAMAAVGNSSVVQAGATKIGTLLGGRMGLALKLGLVAAAALAWVEVINTYNDQKAKIDAQGKDIGKSVGEQIATGTTDELMKSKAALESGIKQLGGVWDLGIFSNDARANLQRQLDAVNAKLLQSGGDIKDDWRANMAGIVTATEGAVHPLGRSADKMGVALADPLHKAATSARISVDTAIESILAYINDSRKALTEAATGAAEAIYGPLVARANLSQTERDLAEQRGIVSSKKSTAAQVADAQQRIIELTQTKVEQLALLVSYGDQSAASALQHQIDVLSATKGLTEEQLLWLRKLQGALDAATGDALRLQAALNGVIRTRTQNGVEIVGHKAAGGPVRAGMPYIVGEYRPELFVPDTNGTIVANPSVASGPAAGGLLVNGLTVQVSGVGSDVSIAAARRFGAEILDTVAEGLREQRARFVGGVP